MQDFTVTFCHFGNWNIETNWGENNLTKIHRPYDFVHINLENIDNQQNFMQKKT